MAGHTAHTELVMVTRSSSSWSPTLAHSHFLKDRLSSLFQRAFSLLVLTFTNIFEK